MTNAYLRMKPPPDFPGRVHAGWAYVHHVVFWQKTGRLPSRTLRLSVHHINEDKHDNRPENLELVTYSEHSKHHAAERPIPLETITCGWCGIRFALESRKVRTRRKAKSHGELFCSRSCGTKHQFQRA